MDYHQGGLSTCPYWSYRIIVNVQGKNGVPLSGAKINQQYTTDGDGKAVFYLPSGNHELTVEVNGYPKKKKSIEVQGDAKSTIIRMMSTGNGDSSSKDDKKDDANDRDEEKLETENKISLGDYHSGVITEDGSLYMWGSNGNGRLGDGTKEDRSNPVKIMDHVKSVSLGDDHSGAITEDGSLYMWGSNYCGELGDGTKEERSNPVKIMDHVRSVSLGNDHSGAITEDGSLYMWGDNYHGDLGDGTEEERSNPVKIMDHVKSVSLGLWHSGAITEDGSLYMWGYNEYGQLGDGTKEDRSNPVKIMDHVKSVSLGDDHSGAITEDGSLYMWGRNRNGQLGEGTDEYNDRRKPVKIMDHVKSVSLGDDHSGAITEDGSLYMWGRNYDGELGDGRDEYERSNPVKVMDHVRSVSLGCNYSGAITEDGSLYMWGRNDYGQLGDGTTTDRLTPVKINDPAAGANGTPQSSIDTVQPLGTADNTATYQNLKPNEKYLFYAVKSETEDDILKASNLLCLTEATSDADGNMSVPYALRESCEDPIFFIRSLSKTDLASAQVKAADLAYNKKEQSVAPEVTFDGKTLTPGVDYEVSGDITATDIGTYKIKITGIGEYTGSVEASYKVVCRHSYGKDWTIDKEATCTAEGRKSRYCTLCGAQADVTTIAKKAHEYQTATTKATTKADGKIVKSCKHCGQTTTTVIAHPKSVALKQTSYTYNKKNRKPSVTIEDTKGNKLKSGTDYTVSYPKKCKNVGRYTVTVKFKGNYQGTVKKSYQILPKGTSLSEVTAKKKGFTAKWKKQKTQTAGYELQYSTNKKFKRKQTKKAVIKKTKTTTYKAKKLKAKKKYYIRIRTYQNVKVNGKTKKLYSSWSKAKSIKTKK